MNIISGRPFSQKEWDKKLKKLTKKLGKKKSVFIELTYICGKCDERFYHDEPCPHTEELRQETIAEFEKQLHEEENPDIDDFEQKMWNVAQRLMYVIHVKGQIEPWREKYVEEIRT